MPAVQRLFEALIALWRVGYATTRAFRAGGKRTGVLSRVVGLFSGRGFNIDSLNVAPALEEGVSHMTITTYGDSMILEQIMKQLHKIVSVIKVMDFADIAAVEREMMFVKVQAEGPMRGEILRTVEIFRCKVVDVSTNEMTIEATATTASWRPSSACCNVSASRNWRAPARWPCAAPRRWIDAPPAKEHG